MLRERLEPSGLPNVTTLSHHMKRVQENGYTPRRKTDTRVSHIFGFGARNKHTSEADGTHVISSKSCRFVSWLVPPSHLCFAFAYSAVQQVQTFRMYREYRRVRSSTSRCRGPSGGWRGRGACLLGLSGWTASGRSCSVCGQHGG